MEEWELKEVEPVPKRTCCYTKRELKVRGKGKKKGGEIERATDQ